MRNQRFIFARASRIASARIETAALPWPFSQNLRVLYPLTFITWLATHCRPVLTHQGVRLDSRVYRVELERCRKVP